MFYKRIGLSSKAYMIDDSTIPKSLAEDSMIKGGIYVVAKDHGLIGTNYLIIRYQGHNDTSIFFSEGLSIANSKILDKVTEENTYAKNSLASVSKKEVGYIERASLAQTLSLYNVLECGGAYASPIHNYYYMDIGDNYFPIAREYPILFGGAKGLVYHRDVSTKKAFSRIPDSTRIVCANPKPRIIVNNFKELRTLIDDQKP